MFFFSSSSCKFTDSTSGVCAFASENTEFLASSIFDFHGKSFYVEITMESVGREPIVKDGVEKDIGENFLAPTTMYDIPFSPVS